MSASGKQLKPKLLSLLVATLLALTVASVVGQSQPFAKLGTYGAVATTPGPSDPMPRITMNGTGFTANGEPFMLGGVNVQFSGLHHPESGCQPISNATFDLFKSWNVNILRVWLNMELASPQYGVWSQAFFDDYKKALDLAESRGIYVLVSGLHQYNLGPAFSGTGFPNWMFTGISTQDAAWDVFYKSVVLEDPDYPEIRTAIHDYYQRITALSKDRAVVMGYDIFNEPEYRNVPGYSRLSASYFYEALSTYITEFDPYKPQAVENNFIDNNYKPNIPNLFVSPHGYAGHTNSYSLTQMKNYFTSSDYWVQGPRWGVPTMNAEWFLGTQSEATQYGLTSSEIATWYDTYITAMEQLGISWVVLRCEASPSQLHWAGEVVKNVLLDHFALNTLP